jgi:SAM-dependent methyltransferase
MSAYHNPDWAECYDLWVREIFGEGPAEDIALFEELMQHTLSKAQPDATISVVDLGTGSGRVLVGLQDVIGKSKDMTFKVWGLEPSSAMLDRAKRFWGEGVANQKNMGHWKQNRVIDHWIRCGATDFADHIMTESPSVDLIFFAAGGIGHITTNSDMLRFLQNVKKVLGSDGKAIVSVLKDFIIGDEGTESQGATNKDQTETVSATEMGQKPQRIPSVDSPGLVYVKHPTTESMTGDIKTERFQLDIEDESGKLLRSHDLSWDERLFDPKSWESSVRDCGLRIAEVKGGQIQVWYLLEHSSG